MVRHVVGDEVEHKPYAGKHWDRAAYVAVLVIVVCLRNPGCHTLVSGCQMAVVDSDGSVEAGVDLGLGIEVSDSREKNADEGTIAVEPYDGSGCELSAVMLVDRIVALHYSHCDVQPAAGVGSDVEAAGFRRWAAAWVSCWQPPSGGSDLPALLAAGQVGCS